MDISSASRASSGGSSPGKRCAIIDLPAPGGPTINKLWPPAAAISSVRFAVSFHVIDERDQRWRRDDFDTSCPGCFRAARCRTDQSATRFGCGKRGRQHPGNRCDLSVERHFAERSVARDFRRRQHTHRSQQSKRDGKVEVAALFRQIRRRQIDCEALIRERKADGRKCRAHALAAFGHSLVAEADDIEDALRAAANMHLNVDFACLDSLKRNRKDVCNGQGDSPDEGGSSRTYLARLSQEC